MRLAIVIMGQDYTKRGVIANSKNRKEGNVSKETKYSQIP